MWHTIIISDIRIFSIIFRDFDPSSQIVVWLWEILDEMREEDKVLFMIFVSGRSRLPANPTSDLNQRFQIMRIDQPVDGLPTAQTCFFQLRLPPYTSKTIMAERMLYAINHCRTIDADNYMLPRNNICCMQHTFQFLGLQIILFTETFFRIYNSVISINYCSFEAVDLYLVYLKN